MSAMGRIDPLQLKSSQIRPPPDRSLRAVTSRMRHSVRNAEASKNGFSATLWATGTHSRARMHAHYPFRACRQRAVLIGIYEFVCAYG